MTSDLKVHMLTPAGLGSSSIGNSLPIQKPFLQCHSYSPHNYQTLVKVALPPLYPSSACAHNFKLVTRVPTATASLRRTLHKSHHHHDVFLPPNQETSCGHTVPCAGMTSFHNHASSCILAGDAKSVGAATIWHALLPARHLAPLETEWDATLPLSVGRGGLEPVAAGMMIGSSDSTVGSPTKSMGTLTRSGVFSVDNVGLPRLGSLNATTAMLGGLCEGSWNAAWDARPTRWLHGRHSAWLLFGVCACFSAAAVPFISAATTTQAFLTDAVVDSLPPPSSAVSTAGEEAKNEVLDATVVTPQTEQSGHGKEIITDYTITGVPGDGRCLFRAVAHGYRVRSGKYTPDETTQRELADELRAKVADELIKRRESTEWFIEGDFDQYVEQMRQTHVWGGEPELIMLSHVLGMPITVYMIEEKTKGGLIAIVEYGQEYTKIDPVQVLYHGFGHYEALQIPSQKAVSKL